MMRMMLTVRSKSMISNRKRPNRYRATRSVYRSPCHCWPEQPLPLAATEGEALPFDHNGRMMNVHGDDEDGDDVFGDKSSCRLRSTVVCRSWLDYFRCSIWDILNGSILDRFDSLMR